MTTERMLRGGSWSFEARLVRCARRGAISRGYCSAVLGLRPVAKALPPDLIRVRRGGSWLGSARDVRCADRYANDSSFCDAFLGLRPVAKAAPPDSSRGRP